MTEPFIDINPINWTENDWSVIWGFLSLLASLWTLLLAALIAKKAEQFELYFYKPRFEVRVFHKYDGGKNLHIRNLNRHAIEVLDVSVFYGTADEHKTAGRLSNQFYGPDLVHEETVSVPGSASNLVLKIECVDFLNPEDILIVSYPMQTTTSCDEMLRVSSIKHKGRHNNKFKFW